MCRAGSNPGSKHAGSEEAFQRDHPRDHQKPKIRGCEKQHAESIRSERTKCFCEIPAGTVNRFAEKICKPDSVRCYGNKNPDHATDEIAPCHEDPGSRKRLSSVTDRPEISTFPAVPHSFHSSSPLSLYASEADKRTIYITNVDIIYNKFNLISRLS